MTLENKADIVNSPLPHDLAAGPVATLLPDSLQVPIRRLTREWTALTGQPSWHLDFALYEHQAVRDQVAEALQAAQHGLRQVVVGPEHTDWLALEQALADLAPQASAIQVLGLDRWLDPHQPETTAARLRGANLRREAFAQRVPVPVLFWLRSAQVPDWVAHAPDLWAWRSAVHRFADGPTRDAALLASPPDAFVHSSVGIDSRSAEQRMARVAELQAFLSSTSQQPVSPLRLDLADELGDLLASVGALNEALKWRQGAVAQMCERLGDPVLTAINRGKIADILQTHGLLDEALRIRQDEELPVYENSGNPRAVAITKGKIADILDARGQRDDALRIRQDEELPVYERLGDVRARAVTMGKIADSFRVDGRLDEALRIRKDEQLPVYERLGDEREKAVTLGRIADILQVRGQLDEALRIRQEQLPVYERLGDLRAKSLSLIKVADILQSRGQVDEAMDLLERQLPVMQAMGDLQSLANLRFRLAMLRVRRGDLEQAAGLAAVADDLSEAMDQSRRLGQPDLTGAVGVILASVLARKGQHDEALAVLDEAEAAFKLLDQPQQIAQVTSLRNTIQQHRGAP